MLCIEANESMKEIENGTWPDGTWWNLMVPDGTWWYLMDAGRFLLFLCFHWTIACGVSMPVIIQDEVLSGGLAQWFIGLRCWLETLVSTRVAQCQARTTHSRSSGGSPAAHHAHHRRYFQQRLPAAHHAHYQVIPPTLHIRIRAVVMPSVAPSAIFCRYVGSNGFTWRVTCRVLETPPAIEESVAAIALPAPCLE